MTGYFEEVNSREFLLVSITANIFFALNAAIVGQADGIDHPWPIVMKQINSFIIRNLRCSVVPACPLYFVYYQG